MRSVEYIVNNQASAIFPSIPFYHQLICSGLPFAYSELIVCWAHIVLGNFNNKAHASTLCGCHQDNGKRKYLVCCHNIPLIFMEATKARHEICILMPLCGGEHRWLYSGSKSGFASDVFCFHYADVVWLPAQYIIYLFSYLLISTVYYITYFTRCTLHMIPGIYGQIINITKAISIFLNALQAVNYKRLLGRRYCVSCSSRKARHDGTNDSYQIAVIELNVMVSGWRIFTYYKGCCLVW